MMMRPEPMPDLPEPVWESLEEQVEAFEAAWARGERPQVADHLPDDDPSRGQLLCELVHAELELRLKAGEPARVEEYVAAYPSLAGLPGAIIDLVAAEFRHRRHIEPGLRLAEYRRRFPAQTLRITALAASGDTVADAIPAYASVGRPFVPGFEVGPLLGRGGMGTVYEAKDLELGRTVAIKVLRSDSDAIGRERLRREAEAAAGLFHPNVVQVYRTGRHAGELFVAMELLAGGTLAERIAGTPLPAKEAATILEPLVRAVAHAHSKGLIHRDLKPANVLFAADGTAKVADFGLAKRIGDDSSLTGTGVTAGSPSYMAPEQAVGDREVGPQADVWALGAVLYEALTGRPPFRGPSVVETLELVRNEDPVPLRRLVPRLPKDLETICLKCLEKDLSKRYDSAVDLADDLARFRRGIPIQARPIGIAEHAGRWAMRHKAVSTLMALLLLSLVAGTSASLWYAAAAMRHAREAAKNLDAVQASETKAREHQHRTQKLLFIADMRRAADAIMRGDPKQTTELVDAHSNDRSVSHPFVLNQLNRAARSPGQEIDRLGGAAYFVGFSPDGRTLVACGASGEIRFYETGTWKPLGSIAAGQGELNGLAYTSDGRRLASAGDDGTVVLWDLATRTPVWRSPVFKRQAFEVAFGNGGDVLAVCGHDPEIRLLDPQSGKIVGSLDGHVGTVESIAVTPDGTTLLSSGNDEWAIAWDLVRGTMRWRRDGRSRFQPLKDVAISADGQWAAFGSASSAIWIIDIPTSETIYRGAVETSRSPTIEGVSMRAVSFMERSRDLLIAADGGNLALTRVVDGRLVPVPNDPRPFWATPRSRIRCLAVGGGAVVSASDDGVVDLWRRSEAPAWKTHAVGDVRDTSWFAGPGGQARLAVASGKGQFTVDPNTGRTERIGRHSWTAVCASSDGRRVLFGSSLGSLECLDLSSVRPTRVWKRHRSRFLEEVFGLSVKHGKSFGATIVTASRPTNRFVGLVQAQSLDSDTTGPNYVLLGLDADTGETKARCDLEAQSCWPAVTPDGETVAVSNATGEVQLLAVSDFSERAKFFAHPVHVDAVAFSPDGRLLATAGYDLRIALWKDGRQVRSWPAGASVVRQLAFSPDGRLLLSVTNDQPPRLWDVETGRLLLEPGRLPTRARTAERWDPASFSPDGGRIVIGRVDELTIVDGRSLSE